MVFNEFLVISNKISRSLHFWLWKLIQNLGLANTAFNEFLIISNKYIGFLLKFYHGFSEQYHIFELRSLFATFESLTSVEFPMYAVVRNSNSKHFHPNASSFQNCSLFEEQLAIYLRSHLGKFSVLYEKTLQSKKQQKKIDTFFTPL